MSPGIWQLFIILIIVLLLFGTKKLRNIGGDLGGAIKNFRSAMRDGEREGQADKEKAVDHLEDKENGRVIEGEATHHDKDRV